MLSIAEAQLLAAGEQEPNYHFDELVIPTVDEQVQPSRRRKVQRGLPDTLDCVHASVHAMEVMLTLIKDARTYIEAVISRRRGGSRGAEGEE